MAQLDPGKFCNDENSIPAWRPGRKSQYWTGGRDGGHPIKWKNHSGLSLVRFGSGTETAKDAKMPIAWIASSPKVLQNNGNIALSNGRGATLHAFSVFADKAVLVFQDAYAENHQGPQIVDHALHTPDPHYIPPTVVLLDSELKKVLATIPYEPDFNKRKQAFQQATAHLAR